MNSDGSQRPMSEAFPTEAPLYDARFEHDACGIGFLVDLTARATRKTLDDGLRCLERLAHRGAFDADGKSGDGAGVLTSIPHTLLNRELERVGRRAQRPGDLAVGMLFLPRDPDANARAREIITAELARRELPILMWRTVTHEPNVLGKRALEMKPDIQQVLIERPRRFATDLEFDQHLYLVRRSIENEAARHGLHGFYIASLSCRTIVYKALVSSIHLRGFYLDLNDVDYKVNLILFHQRYSTNTFPTWERAQPFRFMCHNGEINTVDGNSTWMRAREPMLQSPVWGGEIDALRPIVDETSSDSGKFDNTLELLNLGGRDLRHAMKMMMPQAWEKDPDLSPAAKGFFRFHSALMEPWDGPACMVFTDGALVGMQIDRNGLRPARYMLTTDEMVYAGSEIGAYDVDPEKIVVTRKLRPGRMICADLANRKLWQNDEILKMLSTRKPYREWAQRNRVRLEEIANLRTEQPAINSETLLSRQAAMGWTSEEITMVVKTMYEDATEPVGSMGDDTPQSVLSPKPRPLFSFFKQRFAEVTNPPIDHLREDQVMSLRMQLGARVNLLDESETAARLVRVESPILWNEDLKALTHVEDSAFQSAVIDATFSAHPEEGGALRRAVKRLCDEVERAARLGASLIILSDRKVGPQRTVIPALLAVGAAHHHLIRTGLRGQASLISETGEARETHHFATLIGFGASAVNPYLALDTAREAVQRGKIRDKTTTEEQVVRNYIKAAEKGLLKIMSKMGIATVDSYHGAQIFEAVGLSAGLVAECFTGAPSRIGGIGYDEIEKVSLHWHHAAFGESSAPIKLEHPGYYKERAGGEYHGYSQRAVHALQKAVRIPGLIEYEGEREIVTGIAHARVPAYKVNGRFGEGFALYKEFAAPFHAPEQPGEPRDLVDFNSDRASISIDDVEPLAEIVRRFSTAAMSLGALSPEAHENLAIAMTRLGGLSNSGEGGEEDRRFLEEGNSGIKQIASGRFGVTPAYLMSAAELQIKMAQGSKPGEGGQIPGHKVTDLIARVRHTVPGVALISPPPHHDIYSIEDLSQLIYDLKQINPEAKVSVKLVAQAGVGTIAAGVAKAQADIVLISGASGGTGASPLSSIKNAGMPWELGLAETHQTLLANNLRGRIRVRADGGMKTGRDVVIGALLGADEFSFGTAPLIAEGCIMARVCHLNTCPVGVATQKPELRAKFEGKPEHVMAYLLYVAQDVREHLARLGYRSIDEIIGRSDLLVGRNLAGESPTSARLTDVMRLLDLTGLRAQTYTDGRSRRHLIVAPAAVSKTGLNEVIVRDAREAVNEAWGVRLHYTIRNQDRAIGARLSGEITRKYRDTELPAGAIEINFRGYAGQSFGAFTTNGMRLHLVGSANDYVGKGMRGGEISIRPFPEVSYDWSGNHILGNTALYGATGGALFAAGAAGERFAVRNSGACGVVEGVSDNGCEYMTGGVVVVMGLTGRNFAAGMTGGMAFVYDPDGTFVNRCNTELVDVDRLTHPGMKRLVKSLLKRHYELTNSHRARDLLVRWDEESLSFRRVIPKDRVAEIESINEFSDFQLT
ncbi:MAG TPA: glutamate synthase-related protein [Thermoflexales bacterium]|nr:glutamate synthase-related protein [Thermoflexales bacterium]HQX10191.1 glutamate synthase-related protein [Thermoflexales bacterium]HQY23952.1 glutamate synthase-related protein [Thermoflexales bacterium]HQZ52788.1 glutamate synthase-related protein [Thermoflexales bacterium]HRA52923.1 glutamate synthase-related protein [Thermoflexales bacterium]